MKGVILSIMLNFKSSALHPLLNLVRPGDFITNGFTSLLESNYSCARRLFQDIAGNADTYVTWKHHSYHQ